VAKKVFWRTAGQLLRMGINANFGKGSGDTGYKEIFLDLLRVGFMW
jgi:hypothetical protein